MSMTAEAGRLQRLGQRTGGESRACIDGLLRGDVPHAVRAQQGRAMAAHDTEGQAGHLPGLHRAAGEFVEPADIEIVRCAGGVRRHAHRSVAAGRSPQVEAHAASSNEFTCKLSGRRARSYGILGVRALSAWPAAPSKVRRARSPGVARPGGLARLQQCAAT
jgi:hypothetical protein